MVRPEAELVIQSQVQSLVNYVAEVQNNTALLLEASNPEPSIILLFHAEIFLSENHRQFTEYKVLMALLVSNMTRTCCGRTGLDEGG